MHATRNFLFAITIGGASLLAAGCGPTYPKCENDGHCADKGEYCLNGTCAQCRDNSHCDGAGMQCVGGRCQRDPNYCDDANACPAGRWCRNNQCSADCNDGDCQAGQYCDPTSRRCTAKPECGEFSDNPACPDGQECVGGTCQAKVNQCGGDPVLFDFDKSNIRRDQRGKLDAVAACMQDPNAAALLIEGHCDERGTEEYNLALGERRAEASKRYLEAKGVSAGRLNTRSMGESYPVDSGSNEKAWAKNRRTEFKSN